MATFTSPRTLTDKRLTTDQVMAATDELVAAFAATDTQAYFACFAADATFVFHPEHTRLDDRAAYERLWASWLDDGWRVESCSSSDRLVHAFGPDGPRGVPAANTPITSVDLNAQPDSAVTTPA